MRQQQFLKMLSIAAAARELGIDPRTLRRWIESRTVPAVWVGGRRWRLELGELRRWAKTGEHRLPDLKICD